MPVDWSKTAVEMPPKKVAISIRVDEDVLEFFRSEGGKYLTKMNAVLRSYMIAQTAKKR